MTINPVVSLFCLYLFANFIALVQGINDGGLVLEGYFFELKTTSLVYSFLLQTIILLLLIGLYRFFTTKGNCKKITYGKNWGWFLIIIQMSFLIFNIKTGVNIAGDGARIEGGSVINYVFVLLQPDMLFMLIGTSLLSGRLFLINLIVFLVSMALRGWMGGFFIIIFMVLSRYYPVRISSRSLFCILFLAVLFVLVLPVIIDMKWSMRQGVSVGVFFSSIFNSFSAEKYNLAISYLLNRFQHLGHVALLLENSDKLYFDLSNGLFSSYWMDGLPQHTISKIFGFEQHKLNSYMVEYFFGIEDPTWNTNPGLAGWVFILQEKVVFMALYLFFVVVAPFYFISRYAGSTMLMLIACFSIVYLFHGWFGAYFNIIFYGLILVVISKLKVTNRSSVESFTNKAVN
ncbi:oligosaccharide repeat unit polymerase [Plesiomonas shigelloides]|uniref:O121 family O-antigen flippase n=1 Tax=Plesiomonas shigelloides TaxID=703 RepID=A0A4D6U7V2_PLESH|nr:oligosaccharide repeat unit polymerase [Plesiomonas shigelloides]KAB7675544.1 oligosaccharide repeat unit polymerase [Plesiomonas shigelloides]QCH03320.1 O121 family O-antigen flippase [Plesiomonas shigelloides]